MGPMNKVDLPVCSGYGQVMRVAFALLLLSSRERARVAIGRGVGRWSYDCPPYPLLIRSSLTLRVWMQYSTLQNKLGVIRKLIELPATTSACIPPPLLKLVTVAALACQKPKSDVGVPAGIYHDVAYPMRRRGPSVCLATIREFSQASA